MKLSGMNPYIRYARVHKTYNKGKCDVNICYDCRLFFSKKTKGEIYINDEKYNISTGTAVYLPPGTRYRFDFACENQFEMIVLDFDLDDSNAHITESLGTATEENFAVQKVISCILPPELSSPIVKAVPQIGRMLLKCTENFLQRQEFYREISSALLKMSLIECIKESAKSGKHTDVCEGVAEYVRNNYKRCSLTNEEIADKMGYHPYHLSRIVKEGTGKTLHSYIMDYRIRIAQDLLMTTDYDMERISWETGFSSSAYFIKIFKREMGITPKKYRDNHIDAEF